MPLLLPFSEVDKFSCQVMSDSCDPMDCSHPTSPPPGSSVHGIFQAIILEQIAIFFSRESSQAKDLTWVSSLPTKPPGNFNL